MATLSDLRERESEILLKYCISATTWIEGKFSSTLPELEKNGYPLMVFDNPTEVLIHTGRSCVSYQGIVITPKYDVWWTDYTDDMVTLLTIHGPVHGPKTRLSDLPHARNLGITTASELIGFYFLRTWMLYSHTWCPDELDAAKAKLKMMWSDHPLKCSKDDASPVKEVFDRYIDKVHKHRTSLLQGEPDVIWGVLTETLSAFDGGVGYVYLESYRIE